MQKMQDVDHDMAKWRHEIAVTQPMQIVQSQYMEPNKDYMSNSHQIYCFSDVTSVMQPQPQSMGKYCTLFIVIGLRSIWMMEIFSSRGYDSVKNIKKVLQLHEAPF